MWINGGRLRELRLENGLTSRELAKRVGMSITYISELETGKKGGGYGTAKSLALRQKLADALGTTPESLLQDPSPLLAERSRPMAPPGRRDPEVEVMARMALLPEDAQRRIATWVLDRLS